MAAAVVGEAPSLTQESIGKDATDKQASCRVPYLAPPPQAAPKCSKDGSFAGVNT